LAELAQQVEQDRAQYLDRAAGRDEHLLFEPGDALVLSDGGAQPGFPDIEGGGNIVGMLP
jgi:hypothetical protein